MAKKKKRKNSDSKNKNNLYELKGFGLLLIAIIGCCPFGPVADIIKGFAAFLVGTWWALFLVFVGICGVYMIIKREKPNFLDVKFFGLYIMVIAILTLSHTAYLNKIESINVDSFRFIDDTITVLEETIDSIMQFVKSDGNTLISSMENLGGGIIGAIFSSIFVSLLTLNGTFVVAIALIICGFIMFTGISIYDTFIKARNSVGKLAGSIDKKKDVRVETSDGDDYDYDTGEADARRSITREELHRVRTETVVNEETGEVTEVEIMESTNWEYPPINLLSKPPKNSNRENQEAIKKNIPTLEQVLRDFDIEGKVVSVRVGPAVTQYELEIKAGTRVNKILGLNREIALSLAAKDVRIQAPIPGKNTVGIELPNASIQMVGVREVLLKANEMDKGLDKKLLAVLGKDIEGEYRTMEIDKMPHLLVAGSTGSGKSVCINSIIASILMRTKPDEVKLVLVDPKKVELSIYNGVPHLMTPVVTDPKKANIVLQKIVSEMENRYEIFERNGSKNITSYNDRLRKENEVKSDNEKTKLMPYIVVIIDELADLMLVAAKEVEDSIMRITQMARAAGIHLIVATQRPSTDVITGVVKANIPSRISFSVSSGIDSRTILDMVGAEKLLGKGDMLFLPQGTNTPIRVQGTYISEEETKVIVDFVCKQQRANYDKTLDQTTEEANAITGLEGNKDATEEPLYNEIVDFVVEQGKASTSLLQRRFRLGYNRAARCIDLLEERGIVGPQNGSKPREVLVKYSENDEND
jgi:S-DNA-T family DNA segregation ATPase FtsK/SpoIIIE